MATQRQRIWGWYFFDWASQPYNTLLLTFVFGPYFQQVATAHFAGQGLAPEAAGAVAAAGAAGAGSSCIAAIEPSASTADSTMNFELTAPATRRASVVLPTPGGPHRIIECSCPLSSASRSGQPCASTCV